MKKLAVKSHCKLAVHQDTIRCLTELQVRAVHGGLPAKVFAEQGGRTGSGAGCA